MHEGWNVCLQLSLAEKAVENDLKRKEVLHCRKISVILVFDFQSSKMVAIADHLKWLRVISFVERDPRREDRREERREESREERRGGGSGRTRKKGGAPSRFWRRFTRSPSVKKRWVFIAVCDCLSRPLFEGNKYLCSLVKNTHKIKKFLLNSLISF